jgi:corrinoid protein of di/trimethylamine methyltransferase
MADQILSDIKDAILSYDDATAQELARQALAAKIDATTVAESVTDAIREVGDAFGDGRIFLPELLAAAKATKAAMGIVEEHLQDAGEKLEAAGTLVIGTVQGDVHDIGKNIVAALFTASGYKVVDLGTNVSTEAFVAAVNEHKPELLGMSALLTTTATLQKTVIDQLAEDGLRNQVKVIVGGAAISKGFAESIGADGYAPTAFDGVELAGRLLSVE